MTTRLLILGALAAVTLAPGTAAARAPRGGNVTTPWGTFSSAEMNAAGGNVMAAGAIREQRMQMQYQQQVLKQQQQAQKQYQDYLKKNPAAAAKAQAVAPVTPAPKKKKKRTYDPTHPVGSTSLSTPKATDPAPSTATRPAAPK